MRQTVQLIGQAANADRALHLLREVSNFHRIQASTGYRAAAQHVTARLRSDGLNSTIKSYPADGKSWFFVQKMFLEWDCRAATLWLSGGECLADFKANNLSVIQRSYPADFRDQPLELVLMDRGDQAAAYEGWDLRGKLLFVREHFQSFMDWAIGERGAVGFVTDFIRDMEGVRTRYDLHDIYNYTSFWWKHTPDEPQAFGFVLTPRQGDALLKKCLAQRALHDADPKVSPHLQVSGFVDASLYEGEIEVVETSILGTDPDEEVLLVTHLCHPRSCANDNSSGVAACMEAMNVLQDLIRRGVLPQPRRGIRLINPPEFTGTFAYLHGLGDDVRRFKAGLNVDMVGARQSQWYGPITLTCTSQTVPSVVNTVSVLVMDEVRRNAPAHNPHSAVPLFNTAVTGFGGGSDHIILSDLGIPAPMLGQWPDKTYHSSGDTTEVIDPYVLHKSTTITAATMYALASLAASDVPLLLNKARERFVQELSQVLHTAAEEQLDPQGVYRQVEQLTQFYVACNDSLHDYLGRDLSDGVRASIAEENELLQKLSQRFWGRFVQDFAPGFQAATPPVPAEYAYVPVRTAQLKGPPIHMDDFTLTDPAKAKHYQDYLKNWRAKLRSAHAFDVMVQFNIDGQRNLWEIAQRSITEAQEGSVEYVHEFVQLLKLFGLVEVKEGSG